ncbi:hypothetical protein [Hanstruepera marina]|uniref:hypothetical protein n=1 Tax=Hanstruepera marina TaxID=2873265 RepID=UPI001CA6C020|nr:hypothetical protein [Hanstruepera marina]
MKNLLKTATVMALALIVYSCDSESITENSFEENVNNEFSDQNLFNCDDVSSVIKFVNQSNIPTDFALYTDDGEMITFELSIQPMNSSDLKSFNSELSLEINIRNEEFYVTRTAKFESCRLITIVIDQQNQLEIIEAQF